MLSQSEPGEVGERDGDIGVVFAEEGLLNGERARVERLGLAVEPLVRIEAGEVAKGDGDIGGVFAEGGFLNGARAASLMASARM